MRLRTNACKDSCTTGKRLLETRPGRKPEKRRVMPVLDLFKLDGQVAVVTGGAHNLGTQHAPALAEAGADVAICDLAEEVGRATEAELQELGHGALFGKVDVTKPDQIDAFVAKVVDRFGRIDILVNNAAMRSEERRVGKECTSR